MQIPGNALVALAAAAAWGGGDFAGGMAVKYAGGTTRGALRVILAAHAVSLIVLAGVVILQGGAKPHGAPMWWALGAGVSVAFSLTAFYIALSRGAMGASAAVSGLLAAALPVAVSFATEGKPSMLQAVGFLLAGAAIWIIAASPAVADAKTERKVLGLAILGGLGFGVYFIALRMANPLGVFEPMTLTRMASLATCFLLLQVLPKPQGERREAKLSPKAMRWAMWIALLDTGGNGLFLAATRMGRLDVASVLASLYPAGTILLAAWMLRERPTKRQLVGMVLALVAVVMITL
jgi:drug/metabolite transporter (DMT)-like permease